MTHDLTRSNDSFDGKKIYFCLNNPKRVTRLDRKIFNFNRKGKTNARIRSSPANFVQSLLEVIKEAMHCYICGNLFNSIERNCIFCQNR